MSWYAVELLHEFLQDTAERIYFRLAVTHCSAAVRAQHLESPENQFWEPLASIWHRFCAARSNLGGF